MTLLDLEIDALSTGCYNWLCALTETGSPFVDNTLSLSSATKCERTHQKVHILLGCLEPCPILVVLHQSFLHLDVFSYKNIQFFVVFGGQ